MGCTSSNASHANLRPFEVKRINDWLATTESPPVVYADTSAFSAAVAPAPPVATNPMRRPPTAQPTMVSHRPNALRYPPRHHRHDHGIQERDVLTSTSSGSTTGPVLFFHSTSPVQATRVRVA